MWIFTEIWYFKYGILFPKVTQYGIYKMVFLSQYGSPKYGIPNMVFVFQNTENMVFSIWYFFRENQRYGIFPMAFYS